jgi:hypothetical protein
MSRRTLAILGQLEAISELAQRDCLTSADYLLLCDGARHAYRAMDRAIDRATAREKVLRKRGYLPLDGGAA